MSEPVRQLSLKPSELATVITKLYSTQIESKKYTPLLISGPPGCGKTALVGACAKKLKIDKIEVLAPQMDACDVRGLPKINQMHTEWTIPSYLPRDRDSSGILFYDELKNSPPSTQNALLKFILERKQDGYQIGDKWIMIAAGNRATDRCYTTRLSAAMSNRFIHINIEPDLEDWTTWASINDIAPQIIAFLNWKKQPTLFMSDKFDEQSFCSPRSWEFVSNILKSGFEGHTLQALLEGTVGTGASIELLAFMKATSHISAEDVLANPSKIAIPESADVLWSLTTSLLSYVRDQKNIPALLKFAIRLADSEKEEFSLMFVRNILKMMKNFDISPSVIVLTKNNLWEEFRKRFKAVLDVL